MKLLWKKVSIDTYLFELVRVRVLRMHSKIDQDIRINRSQTVRIVGKMSEMQQF